MTHRPGILEQAAPNWETDAHMQGSSGREQPPKPHNPRAPQLLQTPHPPTHTRSLQAIAIRPHTFAYQRPSPDTRNRICIKPTPLAKSQLYEI
mmetsp:Transcript_77765/g.130536  ORF Transcript_77765/g.130536 Transcript_77765/m.130536 type:complete len:93 (-) Transcript_77765:448-726(-)